MKIFMTNGSLMKVECIAECSRNTFDLHSAIIGLGNPVLDILRVAGLHGFYCRHTLRDKNCTVDFEITELNSYVRQGTLLFCN